VKGNPAEKGGVRVGGWPCTVFVWLFPRQRNVHRWIATNHLTWLALAGDEGVEVGHHELISTALDGV
jgi:hypothetical protein